MQHDLTSQPVVGIDVSKKSLDLFIDQINQRFTIDNTDLAIAVSLIGFVPRRFAWSSSKPLDDTTAAWPPRFLPPAFPPASSILSAREFAKAMGKLEKSDAIDAQILAAFARRIDPKPDQIQRQDQTILADLVSRRRALVRVAEKNRSHDDLPELAGEQSKELLRLIEQQIEDLDREIAKQIQADDDWHNKSQIIDSVPGVGPDSANQLVIDLPELGNLNRQQIAKLAGLAPLVRDSGQFRGQRSIGGGRHNVRITLYMLAHNAVLYCPRFRRFFDQPMARGKSTKSP